MGGGIERYRNPSAIDKDVGVLVCPLNLLTSKSAWHSRTQNVWFIF